MVNFYIDIYPSQDLDYFQHFGCYIEFIFFNQLLKVGGHDWLKFPWDLQKSRPLTMVCRVGSSEPPWASSYLGCHSIILTWDQVQIAKSNSLPQFLPKDHSEGGFLVFVLFSWKISNIYRKNGKMYPKYRSPSFNSKSMAKLLAFYLLSPHSLLPCSIYFEINPKYHIISSINISRSL